MYRSVTRNDSVTEKFLLLHAEVGAAVCDEHADLVEGIGVEEQIYPLTCSKLVRIVAFLDLVLSTPCPCLGSQIFKFSQGFLPS